MRTAQLQRLIDPSGASTALLVGSLLGTRSVFREIAMEGSVSGDGSPSNPRLVEPNEAFSAAGTRAFVERLDGLWRQALGEASPSRMPRKAKELLAAHALVEPSLGTDEGAVAYLRRIASTASMRTLREGDVLGYARTLGLAEDFEGLSPIEEERVRSYAAALASHLPEVAEAMGSSRIRSIVSPEILAWHEERGHAEGGRAPIAGDARGEPVDFTPWTMPWTVGLAESPAMVAPAPAFVVATPAVAAPAAPAAKRGIGTTLAIFGASLAAGAAVAYVISTLMEDKEEKPKVDAAKEVRPAAKRVTKAPAASRATYAPPSTPATPATPRPPYAPPAVQMPPAVSKGQLVVSVVDAGTRSPVKGARVVATRPDGSILPAATTSGAGVASFNVANKPGTYSLAVSSPDYGSVTRTAVVTKDAGGSTVIAVDRQTPYVSAHPIVVTPGSPSAMPSASESVAEREARELATWQACQTQTIDRLKSQGTNVEWSDQDQIDRMVESSCGPRPAHVAGVAEVAGVELEGASTNGGARPVGAAEALQVAFYAGMLPRGVRRAGGEPWELAWTQTSETRGTVEVGAIEGLGFVAAAAVAATLVGISFLELRRYARILHEKGVELCAKNAAVNEDPSLASKAEEVLGKRLVTALDKVGVGFRKPTGPRSMLGGAFESEDRVLAGASGWWVGLAVAMGVSGLALYVAAQRLYAAGVTWCREGDCPGESTAADQAAEKALGRRWVEMAKKRGFAYRFLTDKEKTELWRGLPEGKWRDVKMGASGEDDEDPSDELENDGETWGLLDDDGLVSIELDGWSIAWDDVGASPKAPVWNNAAYQACLKKIPSKATAAQRAAAMATCAKEASDGQFTSYAAYQAANATWTKAHAKTKGKIVSMTISPSSSTAKVGDKHSFKAMAKMSDGSTKDVTSLATWTSSSPKTASVSNGTATALAVGTASISASYSGKIARTSLTVSAAVVAKPSVPAKLYPKDPKAAKAAHASHMAKIQTPLHGALDEIDVLRESLGLGNGAVPSENGVYVMTAPDTMADGKTKLYAYAGHLDPSDNSFTTMEPGAYLCSPGAKGTPVSAFGQSPPGFTPGHVYQTNASVQTMGTKAGDIGNCSGVTTTDMGEYGASPTASKSSTASTVTSIAISPTSWTGNVGDSTSFTATATMSDGSTQDVTSTATWTSSNPSVASIAAGQASALAAGSSTVTVKQDAGSATVQVTVSTASAAQPPAAASTVTSIAISPASATANVGDSTSFTAQATMSDGSTQDVTSTATWSSSAPSVASISAGQASALSAGSATFTVQQGGQSGTASITVSAQPAAAPPGAPPPGAPSPGAPPPGAPTPPPGAPGAAPTATSIALSPSSVTANVGDTAPIKATATMSDGSTQDVTSTATWTSSDSTIATVAAGSVTAVAAGSASVTATQDAGTATAQITVSDQTGAPAPPPASYQPVADGDGATASDDQGDGSDAGDASDSDAGVSGVLIPIVQGGAKITVDLGANPKPPSWNNAVYQACLKRIPAKATSAQRAAATVTCAKQASGGQFTSYQAYQTAHAAWMKTQAKGKSATASIAISPPSATAKVGDKSSFKAMAKMVDGSTKDVTSSATWTSSSPKTASVSKGTATALAAGMASISASFGGKSAKASLTVSTAKPSAVSVGTKLYPKNPAAAKAAAAAHAVKVQKKPLHGVPDEIDVLRETLGLVDVGQQTENGIYVLKTPTTTSAGKPLYAYAGHLNPDNSFVTMELGAYLCAPGATGAPVSGIGQFPSGFTPGHVYQTNASVQTMGTKAGDIGNCSGVTTTDMGEYDVSPTTSTTPPPTPSTPTVTSIAISPTSWTGNVGDSTSFTANATMSDGTTQDVTSTATWTSSNAAVASVSAGQVSAASAGSTTLTVKQDSGTATAQITVSAQPAAPPPTPDQPTPPTPPTPDQPQPPPAAPPTPDQAQPPAAPAPAAPAAPPAPGAPPAPDQAAPADQPAPATYTPAADQAPSDQGDQGDQGSDADMTPDVSGFIPASIEEAVLGAPAVRKASGRRQAPPPRRTAPPPPPPPPSPPSSSVTAPSPTTPLSSTAPVSPGLLALLAPTPPAQVVQPTPGQLSSTKKPLSIPSGLLSSLTSPPGQLPPSTPPGQLPPSTPPGQLPPSTPPGQLPPGQQTPPGQQPPSDGSQAPQAPPPSDGGAPPSAAPPPAASPPAALPSSDGGAQPSSDGGGGGAPGDGQAATLVSISVTPSPATAKPGDVTAMTATATMSDSSTQDVTATADWSVSDPAVASVDAGSVTALAAGAASVTATVDTVSGKADLTVSADAASTSTAGLAGPEDGDEGEDDQDPWEVDGWCNDRYESYDYVAGEGFELGGVGTVLFASIFSAIAGAIGMSIVQLVHELRVLRGGGVEVCTKGECIIEDGEGAPRHVLLAPSSLPSSPDALRKAAELLGKDEVDRLVRAGLSLHRAGEIPTESIVDQGETAESISGASSATASSTGGGSGPIVILALGTIAIVAIAWALMSRRDLAAKKPKTTKKRMLHEPPPAVRRLAEEALGPYIHKLDAAKIAVWSRKDQGSSIQRGLVEVSRGDVAAILAPTPAPSAPPAPSPAAPPTSGSGSWDDGFAEMIGGAGDGFDGLPMLDLGAPPAPTSLATSIAPVSQAAMQQQIATLSAQLAQSKTLAQQAAIQQQIAALQQAVAKLAAQKAAVPLAPLSPPSKATPAPPAKGPPAPSGDPVQEALDRAMRAGLMFVRASGEVPSGGASGGSGDNPGGDSGDTPAGENAPPAGSPVAGVSASVDPASEASPVGAYESLDDSGEVDEEEDKVGVGTVQPKPKLRLPPAVIALPAPPKTPPSSFVPGAPPKVRTPVTLPPAVLRTPTPLAPPTTRPSVPLPPAVLRTPTPLAPPQRPWTPGTTPQQPWTPGTTPQQPFLPGGPPQQFLPGGPLPQQPFLPGGPPVVSTPPHDVEVPTPISPPSMVSDGGPIGPVTPIPFGPPTTEIVPVGPPPTEVIFEPPPSTEVIEAMAPMPPPREVVEVPAPEVIADRTKTEIVVIAVRPDGSQNLAAVGRHGHLKNIGRVPIERPNSQPGVAYPVDASGQPAPIGDEGLGPILDDKRLAPETLQALKAYIESGGATGGGGGGGAGGGDEGGGDGVAGVDEAGRPVVYVSKTRPVTTAQAAFVITMLLVTTGALVWTATRKKKEEKGAETEVGPEPAVPAPPRAAPKRPTPSMKARVPAPPAPPRRTPAPGAPPSAPPGTPPAAPSPGAPAPGAPRELDALRKAVETMRSSLPVQVPLPSVQPENVAQTASAFSSLLSHVAEQAGAVIPGLSGMQGTVLDVGNGVATYTVVKGDSMSSIAAKYGATGRKNWFHELVTANPQKRPNVVVDSDDPSSQANLGWSSLQPGEVINVPAAWGPSTEAPRGASPDKLMTRFFPGQFPGGPSASPAVSPSTAQLPAAQAVPVDDVKKLITHFFPGQISGDGATYTAASGDSMAKIAQRFGAQGRPHWFRELARANPQKKLSEPSDQYPAGWISLQPGDTINIPAEWQAAPQAQPPKIAPLDVPPIAPIAPGPFSSRRMSDEDAAKLLAQLRKLEPTLDGLAEADLIPIVPGPGFVRPEEALARGATPIVFAGAVHWDLGTVTDRSGDPEIESMMLHPEAARVVDLGGGLGGIGETTVGVVLVAAATALGISLLAFARGVKRLSESGIELRAGEHSPSEVDRSAEARLLVGDDFVRRVRGVGLRFAQSSSEKARGTWGLLPMATIGALLVLYLALVANWFRHGKTFAGQPVLIGPGAKDVRHGRYVGVSGEGLGNFAPGATGPSREHLMMLEVEALRAEIEAMMPKAEGLEREMTTTGSTEEDETRERAAREIESMRGEIARLVTTRMPSNMGGMGSSEEGMAVRAVRVDQPSGANRASVERKIANVDKDELVLRAREFAAANRDIDLSKFTFGGTVNVPERWIGGAGKDFWESMKSMETIDWIYVMMVIFGWSAVFSLWDITRNTSKTADNTEKTARSVERLRYDLASRAGPSQDDLSGTVDVGLTMPPGKVRAYTFKSVDPGALKAFFASAGVDKASEIAERAGELQAANPGVDLTKIKVNDTIMVPANWPDRPSLYTLVSAPPSKSPPGLPSAPPPPAAPTPSPAVKQTADIFAKAMAATQAIQSAAEAVPAHAPGQASQTPFASAVKAAQGMSPLVNLLTGSTSHGMPSDPGAPTSPLPSPMSFVPPIPAGLSGVSIGQEEGGSSLVISVLVVAAILAAAAVGWTQREKILHALAREGAKDPDLVKSALEEAARDPKVMQAAVDTLLKNPETVRRIIDTAARNPRIVQSVVHAAAANPKAVQVLVDAALADPNAVQAVVSAAMRDPKAVQTVVDTAMKDPKVIQAIASHVTASAAGAPAVLNQALRALAPIFGKTPAATAPASPPSAPAAPPVRGVDAPGVEGIVFDEAELQIGWTLPSIGG